MKKLSNFEKLAILMQASQDPSAREYALDNAFICRMVVSGNEWALAWRYDFIDREAHPLDAVVEETMRVLEMYECLQDSTKDGRVAADTTFPGFDANNDEHKGIARILSEDLDRYGHIRGVTNNSHNSSSILRYRRMLSRFDEMIKPHRESGQYSVLLSSQQVQELLNL